MLQLHCPGYVRAQLSPSPTAMVNTSNTNGVLPVTTTHSGTRMVKSSNTRAPGPKLKVVIRRLAPALTETEFKSIVGPEWAVGAGKVDWFSFKPGKDSKE